MIANFDSFLKEGNTASMFKKGDVVVLNKDYDNYGYMKPIGMGTRGVVLGVFMGDVGVLFNRDVGGTRMMADYFKSEPGRTVVISPRFLDLYKEEKKPEKKPTRRNRKANTNKVVRSDKPRFKVGDDVTVRKDGKSMSFKWGPAGNHWQTAGPDRDKLIGETGKVTKVTHYPKTIWRDPGYTMLSVKFPGIKRSVEFVQDAVRRATDESSYGVGSKFFQNEFNTLIEFLNSLTYDQAMKVQWGPFEEFGRLHTGEGKPFKTIEDFHTSQYAENIYEVMMRVTQGDIGV